MTEHNRSTGSDVQRSKREPLHEGDFLEVFHDNELAPLDPFFDFDVLFDDGFCEATQSGSASASAATSASAAIGNANDSQGQHRLQQQQRPRWTDNFLAMSSTAEDQGGGRREATVDLFSCFGNVHGKQEDSRLLPKEQQFDDEGLNDGFDGSESVDTDNTRNDVLKLTAAVDWMKEKEMKKEKEEDTPLANPGNSNQPTSCSFAAAGPMKTIPPSRGKQLNVKAGYSSSSSAGRSHSKAKLVSGDEQESIDYSGSASGSEGVRSIPEFRGFAFLPSFGAKNGVSASYQRHEKATGSSTPLSSSSSSSRKQKRSSTGIAIGRHSKASKLADSNELIEKKLKQKPAIRVKKEHPSSNTATLKKRQGLTSSKYNGVCWNKRKNKWRARLSNKGTREFLGDFDTEVEAARAFDKRIKQLMSPKKYFDKLNFKEGDRPKLLAVKPEAISAE